MLKNFKPIGLMLFAGILCSPESIKADTTPIRPSVNISQQNGKLTGTVEDEFGPVTGASVIVKGTTNGIITDLDGKFTLEDVKRGSIIQISFVGYITQEIKYTGQASVNVKLMEDSQALDEVVVTGFSGVQKTKTLTASRKCKNRVDRQTAGNFSERRIRWPCIRYYYTGTFRCSW